MCCMIDQKKLKQNQDAVNWMVDCCKWFINQVRKLRTRREAA